MERHLRFDGIKRNQVKPYAKTVFKTGNTDLKTALKKEKLLLRNSLVEDKSLKKNIIKFGKLMCVLTGNCISVAWIYEAMTESEFITRFVTPLIDLMLKPYRPLLIFKPGEQKLLMVKEYENNALLEENARLPGPNIDGIIRIPNLNLDFVLVEVSGPPCSAAENYSHYRGDRNKIGKNLKYMFKTIISKKGTPCIRTVTRLKLFGLHFYKDTIYVYSISMPMWDVPVFQAEASIKIPVEPILFASTMPRFVSQLFDLGEKIDHFAKEVQNFLAITDYEEDSDSSGSDLSSCSTPRVSPKKRKSMCN
ncbi:hypothetical protein G6F46_012205 [Rhizopus delemar]|uniref:Uncharacterized protein n=3 Tax=Rhizopus TaxID=4842 RepID=I1BK17_RHIO9|nr:hypothetical protein RO3G_01251 [Rhizopus delemar RA 99-880]KAG1445455.1 hypothetical protein G6F55_011952 [Rhizopus delemar]KAG1534037.1 hypothetical protein G6F51_012313 [Rhizopus arrhizus]KAG1499511.1 hypothetical protein G6F54_004362 [Rhizopus delemar]KAG1499793.1 hypothetical protein G6F53_011443 [Rhizopus delemar]|eukprot:EIE76547.1 hypothetical protein RO3G_01251 [Rhizopus delemar RA 99-880]